MSRVSPHPELYLTFLIWVYTAAFTFYDQENVPFIPEILKISFGELELRGGIVWPQSGNQFRALLGAAVSPAAAGTAQAISAAG